MTEKLTIRRPDDWHLHFRDGDIMRGVVPYTARQFARAIVMPNLTPPITTTQLASEYRDRILAALPEGVTFEPLMTCYLTNTTDPDDLARGASEGVFTAAKMYPANATTNSSSGVTDVEGIYPLFEQMEAEDIVLCIHGEVVDADIDVFDREAEFIDRHLNAIVSNFPNLRVVFEHITTSDAVEFVKAQGSQVAATITPQHLHINRNAMLVGGIQPHNYCLPVAKRETHRLALRAAATSADPAIQRKFFLGT
ncbi:MAG: dihydroorotase, partial [Pseudomonadota bacterium]